MMGFDWIKIPSIKNGFNVKFYRIADFEYGDLHVISSDARFNKPLEAISYQDIFHFKPHFGWTGHIELGTHPL